MTTTICSMKKLLGFCIFCSCLTLLACGGTVDSSDGFRVRGVNLGGWLVVEGWTKPSLFSDIPNKDLLVSTCVFDVYSFVNFFLVTFFIEQCYVHNFTTKFWAQVRSESFDARGCTCIERFRTQLVSGVVF